MSSPGDPSTFDPVMLELFAAEADMHLPVLSEGLLALEKGTAGKKEIESMMRAAHSQKGTARIVGNDPAVRIAHALEDCFTAAKEGRITLQSDSVDVLLQGVDALQRTCSPAQDPELNEERMQLLLGRIGGVQAGKATPLAPNNPAPSSAPVATAAPRAAPVPEAAEMIVFPPHVDLSAAQSLRGQLCDILQLRSNPVQIDFGQVTHLSVSGLSLLLSFADEAKGSMPVIEAHRVAPEVRALFRVVGLERALSYQ